MFISNTIDSVEPNGPWTHGTVPGCYGSDKTSGFRFQLGNCHHTKGSPANGCGFGKQVPGPLALDSVLSVLEMHLTLLYSHKSRVLCDSCNLLQHNAGNKGSN